MEEHKMMGIFCRKDRKFYIFDNGPNASTRLTIDKLRNVLIARDLIRMTDAPSPTSGYDIQSLAQAKLDGSEVVTVHVTNHVKMERIREKSLSSEDVWG